MSKLEIAKGIALCWFEGKYDQEQAQLSAELQGIDFKEVEDQYGNIYAECEVICNGY